MGGVTLCKMEHRRKGEEQGRRARGLTYNNRGGAQEERIENEKKRGPPSNDMDLGGE